MQDLNHDGSYSADELIAGLRSGNSFVVQGDLIDGLQFSVQCQQQRKEVVMDRDVLMPREPGTQARDGPVSQVPRTAQERLAGAAGKPLSISYRTWIMTCTSVCVAPILAVMSKMRPMDRAYADLWFYSNPILVRVTRR
ncbi:MAG: hypothetical protein Q7U64_00145 [Desulfocapsaceae bacterium]|nr:hypothetical protein [Desulfocapsaceae bacterium]